MGGSLYEDPAKKKWGETEGRPFPGRPWSPDTNSVLPGPPDYKAYEDAAEEFHPYIPFFATFDSKVLLPGLCRVSLTPLTCPPDFPQNLWGSGALPTHDTPCSPPPQAFPAPKALFY